MCSHGGDVKESMQTERNAQALWCWKIKSVTRRNMQALWYSKQQNEISSRLAIQTKTEGEGAKDTEMGCAVLQ